MLIYKDFFLFWMEGHATQMMLPSVVGIRQACFRFRLGHALLTHAVAFLISAAVSYQRMISMCSRSVLYRPLGSLE